MPTVYRAEIHISGVSKIGPTPSDPTHGAYPVAGTYAFACYDGDGNQYSLRVFLSVTDHDPITGVRVYDTLLVPGYRRGNPDDPISWQAFYPADFPGIGSGNPVALWTGTGTSISGVGTAGDGGAAFLAGGTFAIEKDIDNLQFNWITPFGTLTTPFTWLDYLAQIGTSPLGIGGQEVSLTRTADDLVECEIVVDWDTFQTKTNSTITRHVNMTAVEPGVWDSWNEDSGSLFGFSTVSTPITLNTVQNTGNFETQVHYSPSPPGPLQAGVTSWYRFLNLSSTSGLAIDMERTDVHGVLFRAGADLADATKMIFERSFDNGHTWSSPVTVATDPAWTCSAPTLTNVNSGLYLCWYNGSAILEAKSLDGGGHWAMPVTLPFVGTNPRRVADRNGGPSFYFYIDGSGDMKVAATYDGGATFRGPYTVVASIGDQQIDAEFAPDSSIVVNYIDGGMWKQKRSRNLGITWV